MNELSGFPLNGCDAFMLAMDSGMRRDGSSRNICHLLITLEPRVDISPLLKRLQGDSTFAAVSRLRLSTRFLRTPRWKPVNSGREIPAIRTLGLCMTESDIHSLILSHSFDPRRESPFGVIGLPNFTAGPSLLFYWHHALCDAHGGESLVKRIVTASEAPSSPLTPSQPTPIPRLDAARRAQRTKSFIFSKAKPDIARLTPDPSRAATHRFARITFTDEQTAAVDQGARKLTGGMFPTAFYLAATARAFAACSSLRVRPESSLLVPVPHDMRRVSKQRSPLSNQISVAFFSITPNRHSTLHDATSDVIEQLHETIAGEHHHGMLDFFRLIRRLPSRVLWKVIEHPTHGHPASFYFSDIGSSLSNITAVCGEPVAHAAHYPPNLAPPGLTTVWSRYRGRLEITICYDESRLKEEDLSDFIRRLHDDLLGAAA